MKQREAKRDEENTNTDETKAEEEAPTLTGALSFLQFCQPLPKRDDRWKHVPYLHLVALNLTLNGNLENPHAITLLEGMSFKLASPKLHARYLFGYAFSSIQLLKGEVVADWLYLQAPHLVTGKGLALQYNHQRFQGRVTVLQGKLHAIKSLDSQILYSPDRLYIRKGQTQLAKLVRARWVIIEGHLYSDTHLQIQADQLIIAPGGRLTVKQDCQMMPFPKETKDVDNDKLSDHWLYRFDKGSHATIGGELGAYISQHTVLINGHIEVGGHIALDADILQLGSDATCVAKKGGNHFIQSNYLYQYGKLTCHGALNISPRYAYLRFNTAKTSAVTSDIASALLIGLAYGDRASSSGHYNERIAEDDALSYDDNCLYQTPTPLPLPQFRCYSAALNAPKGYTLLADFFKALLNHDNQLRTTLYKVNIAPDLIESLSALGSTYLPDPRPPLNQWPFSWGEENLDPDAHIDSQFLTFENNCQFINAGKLTLNSRAIFQKDESHVRNHSAHIDGDYFFQDSGKFEQYGDTLSIRKDYLKAKASRTLQNVNYTSTNTVINGADWKMAGGSITSELMSIVDGGKLERWQGQDSITRVTVSGTGAQASWSGASINNTAIDIYRYGRVDIQHAIQPISLTQLTVHYQGNLYVKQLANLHVGATSINGYANFTNLNYHNTGTFAVKPSGQVTMAAMALNTHTLETSGYVYANRAHSTSKKHIAKGGNFSFHQAAYKTGGLGGYATRFDWGSKYNTHATYIVIDKHMALDRCHLKVAGSKTQVSAPQTNLYRSKMELESGSNTQFNNLLTAEYSQINTKDNAHFSGTQLVLKNSSAAYCTDEATAFFNGDLDIHEGSQWTLSGKAKAHSNRLYNWGTLNIKGQAYQQSGRINNCRKGYMILEDNAALSAQQAFINEGAIHSQGQCRIQSDETLDMRQGYVMVKNGTLFTYGKEDNSWSSATSIYAKQGTLAVKSDNQLDWDVKQAAIKVLLIDGKVDVKKVLWSIRSSAYPSYKAAFSPAMSIQHLILAHPEKIHYSTRQPFHTQTQLTLRSKKVHIGGEFHINNGLSLQSSGGLPGQTAITISSGSRIYSDKSIQMTASSGNISAQHSRFYADKVLIVAEDGGANIDSSHFKVQNKRIYKDELPAFTLLTKQAAVITDTQISASHDYAFIQTKAGNIRADNSQIFAPRGGILRADKGSISHENGVIWAGSKKALIYHYWQAAQTASGFSSGADLAAGALTHQFIQLVNQQGYSAAWEMIKASNV